MYEFFSVRFLTTEAMLPLLPWTARHWPTAWQYGNSFPVSSSSSFPDSILPFTIGVETGLQLEKLNL
jgi:hypothetical protein